MNLNSSSNSPSCFRPVPGGPAGLPSRRFALPPEQVPAAENWVAHGERAPRAVRFASSVALIRDGNRGVETYLGYRRGTSPLGVVAFPGGSEEGHDGDADIPWFGPSVGDWAKRLSVLDHVAARRRVVCAARELFEETGVLLAGSDPLSIVEDCSTGEWMEQRRAVAEQDLSFTAMLAGRGLGLRTDLLRPLARWISPDFALRRFDTWYFAAAMPVRQRAALLDGKGTWAEWLPARQVLDERAGTALGDRIGHPETVGRTFSELTVPAVEAILEKIATTRGTVAYLAHPREPKTYHPQLREVDGGFCLEVHVSGASEGGTCFRSR
nr:NUDIX hydrolase [Zhihengliuella sp.]